MIFGFVCVFVLIWWFNCVDLIERNIKVDPWAYLFVVLGWSMLILPAAYKISFGG